MNKHNAQSKDFGDIRNTHTTMNVSEEKWNRIFRPQEYDTVTVDGETGTIVHVYSEAEGEYEVEFDDGVVKTVTRDEIEKSKTNSTG